jgi:hypothetical protein
MGKLSAVAIIVLAIPALAAAQHRGGMAGPAMAAPFHGGAVVSRAASAPVRSPMRVQSGTQSAARSGAPALRTRGNGVRVIHRNNSGFGSNGTDFQNVPGLGFDFGSNGTDFQNVPGLGFDYPHLAAVSGNHRRHGSGFGGEFPFGSGGFLFGPSVIVEEVPAAESQPTVVEDQVADDAPEVQRPPRRERAPRVVSEPQPESTVASAPQPDPEQFVFVRRDGGLVFAVAYSWDNGTLRYVTPEGLRRSMGRDALDLNATQQFNEQRGLNFRVPA